MKYLIGFSFFLVSCGPNVEQISTSNVFVMNCTQQGETVVCDNDEQTFYITVQQIVVKEPKPKKDKKDKKND